jgi:UDP-N-acetyl-D-glucosamine dehydrogenase
MGARVLLLGLAYKRDVGDCRESPALELMAQLEARGAQVGYHDPHVAELPRTRRHPQLAGRRSLELDEARLRQSDVVLLVTDHGAIDYARVLEHAALIVDTRGVFRAPHGKVVKA